MSKKTIASAVFAIFGFVAAPVLAVPFSATPADVLGPLNGGSVTHVISSPGASIGDATLTFDLLGYNTVDGSNCCTDIFELTVNSNLLFRGAFDMGGGGANLVNFIDPGVTIVSSTSPGINQGGLTQFSVAHALLSGNNTYVFDYGNMQGLADEGWGLRSVSVSAEVSTATGGGSIPEPAALALMGLGLLGLRLSQRRKA